MTSEVIHSKTLWGSLILFGIYLVLAIVLGMDLPERYPSRFDSSGTPTQWSEGPGSWILLVAVGAFCFGQGFLVQRFLLTDPDSSLLNLPQKERFRRLPREEKVPIVRQLNRMLGVLNIMTLLLFCGILLSIYFSAVAPESSASQFGEFWIWAMVAGVILIPFAEVFRVRRMILRAHSEENSED